MGEGELSFLTLPLSPFASPKERSAWTHLSRERKATVENASRY